MEAIDFQLNGEYIELIQLLKATGIAETGGHAKMIVENGLIVRNGEIEFRKRAKLISVDIIVLDDIEIPIV